jgi:hypothetical protein
MHNGFDSYLAWLSQRKVRPSENALLGSIVLIGMMQMTCLLISYVLPTAKNTLVCICIMLFFCVLFLVYALTGKHDVNVLEGSIEDSSHLFIEKEIVSVTLENGFIQGATAIMSSHCEVYPNMGLNTNV